MVKHVVPSLRSAPSAAIRPAQSCRESDAERVRQAVHAKLAHQIGTVNLDRARRDSEIIGNRFVGEASRQALQRQKMSNLRDHQLRHEDDGCGSPRSGGCFVSGHQRIRR